VTNDENIVTEVAGRPVLRVINRGPGGDSLRLPAAGKQIFYDQRDPPLDARSPPAFLHVFLANWLSHIAMAEKIAKGLGPEYCCGAARSARVVIQAVQGMISGASAVPVPELQRERAQKYR